MDDWLNVESGHRRLVIESLNRLNMHSPKLNLRSQAKWAFLQLIYIVQHWMVKRISLNGVEVVHDLHMRSEHVPCWVAWKELL
jgi:hypothetical protein